MLYEVRTYRLKQGTTNKAIDAFAEGYETRKKYSKIAAFWYTEIGPLNEIIHVWPYESLDERARIRAEAAEDPNWRRNSATSCWNSGQRSLSRSRSPPSSSLVISARYLNGVTTSSSRA